MTVFLEIRISPDGCSSEFYDGVKRIPCLGQTARESDDGVNRMGSYLGVMGQSPMDFERDPELHPGDRLSCERYGLRLAQWMARVQ
ncbi:hypothetical protein [Leptolyngbya sp. PCC 6406]|uniref:hypothetical protein n=1 Tax=Leptolyngbya sp. PCC 6406 TaxID=1173264 RepID=UPI0002AC8BD6|nr:hypothetical protein [Leptolyngbya sp. PCC 6406]